MPNACFPMRVWRRVEGAVLIAILTVLASAQASAARKVVAVGDPSPGEGTFTAVGGDSPLLVGANDRGDVLFWSGVAGGANPYGVFLFADGAVTKIIGEGDSSPLGGTFVNLFASTGTYRLNNVREVAFVAAVRGGSSDGGVFLYSGGVIRAIAASGDRAPLPALIDPISEPDIFVGGFAVDLNDGGDVLLTAMQGKRVGTSFVSTGGVYLAPPGAAVDRIVTSGIMTEVGRLNLSAGSIFGPFVNNNREFVLWAATDRPTQGVFLCQAGSCQKVVALGDPIPGGTWPLASGPCCIVGFNDLRQVALQGLSLRGEILIWAGGIFQRDIAPGYPVAEPVPGTLDAIYGRNHDLHPLNNLGEIAFSGSTVLGGPAAYGIFVLSDATLRKRVSAQDPAPGHGSFVSFGRSTVNNVGCITFEANTSGALGYYSSIWQDCARQKVPLGGALHSGANPGYFKVYMPTKWGGKLKIDTLGGTRSEVRYPDGAVFTDAGETEKETGENKQGWYTFEVAGSTDYEVYASFTQDGEAARRPWNFYWWAAKASFIREPLAGGNGTADSTVLAGSDDLQVIAMGGAAAAGADIIRSGPNGALESSAGGDDELVQMINLYSTTGVYQPLDKYDARHGTAARAWEAANHQSQFEWCGHCLGCTVASIKLNQPTPAAGSTYNEDEVEALWCELGENEGHLYPDEVGPVPPGPPSPGPDPTDFAAPTYHRLLEQYVRSAREALYSNMRADGSGSDEVWNHAVYKFEATFEEAPGGNEKTLKIANNVSANGDILPPSTDGRRRQVIYKYIITYQQDGSPDTAAAAAKDWISVEGEASWAPKFLSKVGAPSWNANNPLVTQANVRADDAANP